MILQNLNPTSLDTVENVQLYLNSLNETFYLTGSRFFGNFHSESDWDYFTTNKFTLEKELKEIGFEDLFQSGEFDNIAHYANSELSLCTVLQKKCKDGIVQIQLINPCFIQAKIKVQTYIKRNYIAVFSKLSKQERKEVWKVLIDVFSTDFSNKIVNNIINIDILHYNMQKNL
jgi:hypothetical protein